MLVPYEKLNDILIKNMFEKAKESERKREAFVIHKKGDYHNKVFNFMLNGTYMQPHLHPGREKIEHIYVVVGEIIVFLFDDDGIIKSSNLLSKTQIIEIPAYTFHTYLIMTDQVITYETMDGVYDPKTWKKMAAWAPEENTKKALIYKSGLYDNINKN